ncbi:RNA polymerase III subunit C17 [Fusarium tjaetaba]|uniref:DNA-directed RNA polymerase III subunit RPC9 n=1 Tax=Fusarium tjaetaba TaxID=1567544 RepID=A0A8H5RG24_9HYPO|nr:RNA polymerase III subunit C17 [Fusarium tjaetaba]KAF5631867.1 RNA polymerase III subunit C17 [Fusarium tjaetaba]
MKILEAQSAVLTNYEVYQHVSEQRERYKNAKRRGPPNLETVVRELLQYLRTNPGPLSQEPLPYTEGCISRLLERLRPYNLAKGEVVMIINLRPASVAALNTVVEEMTERFSEEQQEAMVNIIAEVLGRFPTAEEGAEEEGADVSMNDAAA